MGYNHHHHPLAWFAVLLPSVCLLWSFARLPLLCMLTCAIPMNIKGSHKVCEWEYGNEGTPPNDAVCNPSPPTPGAPPQVHNTFSIDETKQTLAFFGGIDDSDDGPTQATSEIVNADVVVYGANAGGVLASVAAARGGAKVALLCEQWPDCFPPSLRIGGLTTGGLSFTDSCHQSVRTVLY